MKLRSLCCLFLACLSAPVLAAVRPNIVFILADDLGYGDLGCYGQKLIRTPNLDKLAQEGMKMNVHYSGNNVCAPSRCVLMSGKHPGHAFIRDNVQAKGYPEGQMPVPEGELTLPLTLQKLGYTNGGFGKWGLGPVNSSGDPLAQGFTRFYGYNCQAVGHNFYPTALWSDRTSVPLDNPKFSAHQKLPEGADPAAAESYAKFSGRQYAPDLIAEQALAFVRQNKDKPFFLFYPTTVPHLALQVPEDSLAEYKGKFPETPYPGGRGYLPHPTPRAAYAAMITRMDREIGKLLTLLEELKLTENTLVVFTSDNGPLYDELGGTDTDFFKSAGDFKGRKGSMDEGGVRVPCLVKWSGHIAPGSVSQRVTGFEDWLPTFLELMGETSATPPTIDGVSFASTLTGKKQQERAFLYRESPGYGGQQFIREGNWKLVRKKLHPPGKVPRPNAKVGAYELYDLAADPAEAAEVSSEHPEIVARLSKLMTTQHQDSAEFPIRFLDREK
jgi:arylsulfatase A